MTKVAYSFDAGAHAFLFIHEDMLDNVVKYFQTIFSLKREDFNEKGRMLIEQTLNKKETSNISYSEFKGNKIKPKAIWVTDVGRGAEQL